MEAEEAIRIEVVYATSTIQDVVVLEVPRGTRVRDAIIRSGLAPRHTEIDVDHAPVGIYGRRVRADDLVQAADRIEIYRELIADPGQARRARAART